MVKIKITLDPQTISKLRLQAHLARKSVALNFNRNNRHNDYYKFKDEAKKLHLVDQNNNRLPLMTLQCVNCKKQHPDTPASLRWLKQEYRKGKLVCPYCKGRKFININRQKPQGERIAELIEKKSKYIKRYIEDENGI